MGQLGASWGQIHAAGVCSGAVFVCLLLEMRHSLGHPGEGEEDAKREARRRIFRFGLSHCCYSWRRDLAGFWCCRGAIEGEEHGMDVVPQWEKYLLCLLPTLQLCMCMWEPRERCLHTHTLRQRLSGTKGLPPLPITTSGCSFPLPMLLCQDQL